MLYSINTGNCVTCIPHKSDFDKWMRGLSEDDYKRIEDALNDKID